MEVKKISKLITPEDDCFLAKIEEIDQTLKDHFAQAMVIDKNLNRQLVSFQANKKRTHYRWYKYKEAFSADLVEYLFRKYKVQKGTILDPFVGAGTALFASAALGYDAEGIEVLPVGQEIVKANVIARGSKKENIVKSVDKWILEKPWNKDGNIKEFEVLRITDGAYSKEIHRKISRYLYELENEDEGTNKILFFALLCILESISFTRKDGQYLRWDYRSGRRKEQNTFDKGKIYPFDEAIINKLNEIRNDISIGEGINDLPLLNQGDECTGDIKLLSGSCLDILPSLKSRSCTGIITSPPYCNRYDYTRTYALEHALLGVNEAELVKLRQAMLSCTVENKSKELIGLNTKWRSAIEVCDQLPLLQEIIKYLNFKKDNKELNNSGIARMVKGYFYEMACVIQECYRVLNKNGIMFMVNDNVRFAGASISVDTILSKIAEDLGFEVENILVLPLGKGNSSQQMGKHGREPLRKCVYVWRKK